MCLIIDANVAADFVNSPNKPAHATINAWLEQHGGTISVGGKLLTELTKVETVRRRLRVLLQAGRAKHYPQDAVDSEQQGVETSGICQSDDPHVIALARVSGARVLFSFDRALCNDFRNTNLVPRPVGKIYRTARHRRLLLAAPKCCDYRRSQARPELVR
jgi:predicted nucleic acid-binding protein